MGCMVSGIGGGYAEVAEGAGDAGDAEKRGVWGGPMETESPSGLGVG